MSAIVHEPPGPRSAAIIERNRRYLLPTYARADLVVARGRGAEIWDADGRRCLDFFSSILCTNLGHCHPVVTAAIQRQAETIVHVSNIQHSEPQSRLAELLVEHRLTEEEAFALSEDLAVGLARRTFGSSR